MAERGSASVWEQRIYSYQTYIFQLHFAPRDGAAQSENEGRRSRVTGIINRGPSEVTLLMANTLQPSITGSEQSN